MQIEYLSELPVDFNNFSGDNIWFGHRAELQKKYSWAIPTDTAIDAILGCSARVVEIGAGNGYWAHLLASRGADVRAYDNGSWNIHGDHFWHQVKRGGPGMLRHFPGAVVLICWPPYDDPLAYNVANRIRVGQLLVFIGEGEGGCTGDARFFGVLDDHFECLKTINIPQWYGLHDRLWIYKKVTDG